MSVSNQNNSVILSILHQLSLLIPETLQDTSSADISETESLSSSLDKVPSTIKSTSEIGKKFLKMCTISSDSDKKMVRKTLKKWNNYASCKNREIQKLGSTEMYFGDAQLIGDSMYRDLKDNEPYDVHIIKDRNHGKIQSIAFTQKFDFSFKVNAPCTELAYLLTNPKNIHSESLSHYPRFKGAGRKIVYSILKDIPDDNILFIESLISAAPFYRKIGCIEIKEKTEMPPLIIPFKITKNELPKKLK